jgi:hypothetical protein
MTGLRRFRLALRAAYLALCAVLAVVGVAYAAVAFSRSGESKDLFHVLMFANLLLLVIIDITIGHPPTKHRPVTEMTGLAAFFLMALIVDFTLRTSFYTTMFLLTGGFFVFQIVDAALRMHHIRRRKAVSEPRSYRL